MSLKLAEAAALGLSAVASNHSPSASRQDSTASASTVPRRPGCPPSHGCALAVTCANVASFNGGGWQPVERAHVVEGTQSGIKTTSRSVADGRADGLACGYTA